MVFHRVGMMFVVWACFFLRWNMVYDYRVEIVCYNVKGVRSYNMTDNTISR